MRHLLSESEITFSFSLPFFSQEEDMPEEVNIDELLDLQSDEERTQKLKVSAFWNYWWRNQW